MAVRKPSHYTERKAYPWVGEADLACVLGLTATGS